MPGEVPPLRLARRDEMAAIEPLDESDVVLADGVPLACVRMVEPIE